MLRILHRAEAATAEQLTHLVYHHKRIANRRLLHLWRAGLVERTALARTVPYGSGPYAYRLSDAAHRRIAATTSRPRGASYLRHTLDIVEVVARLTSASPPGQPIVDAWFPESLARGLLRANVRPDSLLLLRGARGTGTLWLEVDEGTQHRSVIRGKLAAYETAFAGHPDWLVLFVVPDPMRLAWLQRTAALDGGGRPWGWTTTMADIERGLAADVSRLKSSERLELGTLLVGTRQSNPWPVGTAEWIELLGRGGGESLEL